MGILDDLAMGFGFKERTADYDARTARTIAGSQAERAARRAGASDHAATIAGIRARQNYNPSAPTGPSADYLNRAGARGGYDVGAYRPAIAQDNRPFMQRLLFSPQGDASPNPYAIGPMSFDQPLPMPGLLGILSNITGFLGGPREPGTVSAPQGPMRVRPTDYTAPPAQVAPLQGTAGTYTAAYEPKVPDIRLRRAAGTYTAPYAVSASLLDDYDYLMDPDMPAAVGLAPEASDAPDATPDPEYDAFVEAARQDPLYAGVIDNPEAMRNIYNMYKEQMGQ
jgi:hypothetical protein